MPWPGGAGAILIPWSGCCPGHPPATGGGTSGIGPSGAGPACSHWVSAASLAADPTLPPFRDEPFELGELLEPPPLLK